MKKNILKFIVPCGILGVIAFSSFKSAVNSIPTDMNLKVESYSSYSKNIKNIDGSFVTKKQTIDTETHKVNVESTVTRSDTSQPSLEVEQVLSKY
ncbi:hypothetical protein GCM10022289_10010 [Pedobacter jeongneungensis]|uniref:Uncharacterized protein n=1 Tax=Pedobacter jeongneungensis TaxID=947309 RepID=A0ABP8B785_9SPHI